MDKLIIKIIKPKKKLYLFKIYRGSLINNNFNLLRVYTYIINAYNYAKKSGFLNIKFRLIDIDLKASLLKGL